MRILWLTPYLPVPKFGAGTRVFHLLKVLAATCDIDLIASDTLWHPIDELHAICRAVEIVPPAASSRWHKRLLQSKSLISRHPAQYWMLYSPRMQERIDQSMREGQYDVVIMETSMMGYYSLPAGTPIVLDQHNVESEIFLRAVRRERSMVRRAYNLLEYWKYQSDEKRFCAAADLVIATSARDCEAMHKWKGMRNCIVVPNGVDTSYFADHETNANLEQQASVLFTGTMHYAPNTEAMLYFTAEIWPLIQAQAPHATLSIVGGVPPREILQLAQIPNVTIAASVPDVRPYLASSQVVVAPLRIGGGTRLKILEAMSMSKAIVSTSLGCEGLEVQDGRHLLVADEPAAFAARVTELLNDPGRRAALGQEGRRLVEDQYDWCALGMLMDTELRELAGFTTRKTLTRDKSAIPLPAQLHDL